MKVYKCFACAILNAMFLMFLISSHAIYYDAIFFLVNILLERSFKTLLIALCRSLK